MSSSSDRVEWDGDRYWYELADGDLRVYAADVSERDREQRDLFTTHVAISLSDVERAVGDDRIRERSKLPAGRGRDPIGHRRVTAVGDRSLSV